jgi:hypothetical protein
MAPIVIEPYRHQQSLWETEVDRFLRLARMR